MWSSVLILGTVLLQAHLPQCNSTSTTKQTTTTSKPTTTTSPATTSTDTTTITTTTIATTTTATTTTATTTIVTTTVAPLVGGNCAGVGDESCNASIAGSAECLRNVCNCANDHMELNSTMCIPVDDLMPGVVNVTSQSPTTLNITWDPPTAVTAYSMDVDYNVTCRPLSTNTSVLGVSNQLNESHCIDLTPGDTYNVSVTCSNGTNSRTRFSDLISLDPAMPGKINSNASMLDAPNVTLVLAPAVGIVHQYQLTINTTTIVFDTTNFTVTELSPGKVYNVTIIALSNNRSSLPRSDGFRTTTTVPGDVTNLDVTPSNSSLIVTWQRPLQPNGDIIGYRVDWKSVDTNCSLMMNATDLLSNNEMNSSCSQNASVLVVNQMNMEYNISGLQPFTNYTVTVTAYTTAGAGISLSVSRLTSSTIPEAVNNVMVDIVNSTSGNIMWDITGTNPGPVTYTVMVVDQVWNTTTAGCQVQGFSSAFCVQANLEEYWPYQFFVEASTNAGGRNSSLTNTTTTDEGVPGEVTNISYDLMNTSSQCDATKVLVSWTEPFLMDRNAKITFYTVEDMQKATTLQIYNVTDPNPYRNVSAVFSDTVGSLKAETVTHLTIHATTQGKITGRKKEFNVTTSYCAPPSWKSDRKISLVTQTTSTFTISVITEFFRNSKQGSITNWGLVVSLETVMNASYLDHIGCSWQDSQASKSPYTIRPLELIAIKASTETVDITVGSNSTCTTSSSGFCNAPLPENTPFHIMAFACTGLQERKKCSSSPSYGPFATLVTEDDGGIGGGIVGAIIALFAAISFLMFAVLWFRGVIDPPGWLKNKNTGSRRSSLTSLQEIVLHRPIILSNYQSALRELHRDTNLLLSDQYDDINKLTEKIKDRSSFHNADLEPNKAKNRWVNVLPYDHSRVKLLPLDDDDTTSDYINANYMPGFNNRREYIATQGPLPGTVDDFWRMIWEHNVKVIVMLTQCKEGNRVKCEQYWPSELHEAKQYGDVIVNPVSISPLDKYNITIFEVIVNNQKQRVLHLHYLEFPDMSANVEFNSFIDFLYIVRSHVPHDMESPMVIHCSAGVGRTGTFIILDRLNQLLASPQFSWGATVDIFNMVMSLRENRVLMVQTESQYIMIHDCLSTILEEKKAEAAYSEEEDENLYQNEAFDSSLEIIYENVNAKQMKTEV